jgi:hypothetical protein
MPAATVASITGVYVLGETTRRPPTARTRSTSAGSSTVPAPISARSPSAPASRPMLSNGSGELSGTSMMRMPSA